MDPNAIWNRFFASGKVNDYLHYVAAIKGEQPHEDQYRRPDHQEGRGGGK